MKAIASAPALLKILCRRRGHSSFVDGIAFLDALAHLRWPKRSIGFGALAKASLTCPLNFSNCIDALHHAFQARFGADDCFAKWLAHSGGSDGTAVHR